MPRLWPDSTIVCLGAGPSLTLADCDRVRPYARVIAINNAIDLMPAADVLYAADQKWWDWYPVWLTVPGLRRFTTSARMKNGYPTVQALGAKPLGGLSLDPQTLVTGGSGGYAAVNLAVLLGARRVVLLGYDMQTDDDGRHHFFGDHPDRTHLAYASRLRPWPALVTAAQAQGVEVWNASRRTALTAVPQRSLDALFPACAVC